MEDFRPRTIRAGYLMVGVSLLLLTYIVRLLQLQVFQFDFWRERSEKNHSTKRILEMKRGGIFDRNGSELALSVETYMVYLYTKEIHSLKDTANVLATVLPLTRDEIISKVGNRKGYIPIYKNLEREQATKLMALNLKGVSLEETFKRVYPQNTLASNLIGFCGADGHGLEGLELSFDKTMRGYPGIAVEEDLSSTEQGVSKMRIVQPPAGGSNIYLTIDSFIQHLLETELSKVMEKYKPIDATSIVMDPYTGEVLGMACLPNYDLNSYADSPFDSHRNRPVVDFFEPGSCMKIFAVGAGLKYKRLNAESRFYCRGYTEMYGRRIKCHGNHALVDLKKAVAESCNSAMIQISQLLDPRELYRTLRELGFGEPTGIELPAESQGILSPPSRWSGLSAPSICIGQEIAVTGIQLVAAYSAIANGGWLVKPKIVRRIVSQKGDIDEEFPVERKRRIFSEKISEELRKYLLGVVEFGTGKLAALPNFTVSGKTSTAQKANPKGGYFSEKVVTSFIGLIPALKPRFVLLVAVNEPKGDERTLYGGKVAAPVFAVIADRILKYAKVPPDKEPFNLNSSGTLAFDGIADPQTASIAFDPLEPLNFVDRKQLGKNSTTGRRLLPDFRGMTLKQALNLTQQYSFPVQMEGNGIVIEQNPSPGVPINRVDSMTLKFAP